MMRHQQRSECEMTDIVVPTLGESVSEATVAKWMKKAGDTVRKDETLVELETDKVSVEVSAPEAGVLSEIVASRRRDRRHRRHSRPHGRSRRRNRRKPKPRPRRKPKRRSRLLQPAPQPAPRAQRRAKQAPPSVQRIAAEGGIDVSGVSGSGRDGRVTKADALAIIENRGAQAPAAPAAASAAASARGRRPRRARADDAPPPNHRAPPQGSAEHRRDADDVQRGRHVGHHGGAQQVQGQFREEARREARLHVLLREGVHRRAEGNPERQRRDRRRRHHLQEFLRHRHRRRHRSRPRRAGGARRGSQVHGRDRKGNRRTRRSRRATAT